MAGFTKLIFEQVLNTKYNTTLEILGLEQGSNPKESTCKGGLLVNNYDEDNIESIVLKDSSGVIVNEEDTYASINEAQKVIIESSVKDFFNFALYSLPSLYDLDKNFGVDDITIKIAQDVCKNDLATYLEKGIALSTKESGNVENRIEDALSFYPIKGVIQSLSEKIFEHYNHK